MRSGVWILLMVMAGIVQAAPPPFDANAEAASLRNAYAPQVKNRAAVQKNWVQPFTSTDQLATPNGTKFNVSLSCEGERKALDMLLVPGATGDIDTLTVMQDLGSDGVLDTNSTFPFSVSGICANGVVSCTPGTWSACEYYKWTAKTGTGELAVSKVTAQELGGCYCTNNHCGNNLVMSNLNNVFGDLMGGAMATANAASTKYLPSRLFIDGITASYFVRGITLSGAGCANPDQPTAVYSMNPASLTPDAVSATNTNDVYKLIANSGAAQQSKSEVKACGITRQMTIKHDDKAVLSCVAGTWFASNTNRVFDYFRDEAWIEAQILCDPTGPNQIRIRAWDGGGNANCNAQMGADAEGFVTLTMPANDAVANGYVMTHPNLISGACSDVPVLYNGSCAADGTCSYSFQFFNGDLSPDRVGKQWVDHAQYSPASCAARPKASFKCLDLPGGGSVKYTNQLSVGLQFVRPKMVLVPDLTTCRIDQEWVDDQCVALEPDPKCKLLNEDIDSVSTVANFQPTGLIPLGSTISQSDGLCNLNIGRDWWIKKRDYRCYTAQTYNFDEGIARAAYVRQNTDPTALTYQDKTMVKGAWEEKPNLTLATGAVPVPNVSACTQACKTRLPHANTTSSTLGVDADQRKSDLSYDYHFKECSAAAVCPLEGTEERVTDCTCMNEFGEAAAVVQVMRLGGKDLICTSGTPQNQIP